MIKFLIHFKESSQVQIFLSSISEDEIVIEYSVKDSGTLLVLSLECSSSFGALLKIMSVHTLLKNLKFDVRPYAFSFSKNLD